VPVNSDVGRHRRSAVGVLDLFSKRQRRARGEVPDVYVYDKLPQELRVQIVHIVQDAFGQDHYSSENATKAYEFVKQSLSREYGLFELIEYPKSDAHSVFNFFLQEKSTERALDVVELCFKVINSFIRDNYRYTSNTDRKIEPDHAVKLETTSKIPKSTDYLRAGHREQKRAIQYRFEALEHKDQSFAHEAEVRLILNFTPFNVDTLKIARKDMAEMRSRPETDFNHPEYDRGMLLYGRAILREEAWKRSLSCLPSISLPLPAGFIQEVTIDPRCPSHKQRIMRDYFQARGVPVVDSSCFGHVGRRIVVSARRGLEAKQDNK